MPRNYKAVKPYYKYDTKKIAEAVNAVKSGAMSVRRAAEAFGIPKSTVGDRVSGKVEVDVRSGRKPHLPHAVEEKLVDLASAAAERGLGVSRRQLLSKTERVVQAMDLPPFKNGAPTLGWLEGLYKRFPAVTTRKPEKLGTARASMTNEEVISKYFDDLDILLKSLNLHDDPNSIWNCDETGKQLCHDPVRVIAKKGTKNVVGRTSNDRTSVTIMACVNASGNKMPPMLVVKGKTSKSLSAYNVSCAPEGTVWAYQEKAWMTEEIGELWFRDVFVKNCGPKRPQLLILDGHSSHESLGLLEYALKESIYIICLPPHTTHALQPLDRTVFGPFNKAFNKVCSAYLATCPVNVVNKWSFPYLFNTAWEEGVSSKNVKSGFAACGIYPFNRKCVSANMLAPSMVTDRTPATSTAAIPCATLSIPDAPTAALSIPDAPTAALSIPDAHTAALSIPDAHTAALSIPDAHTAALSIPDAHTAALSIPDAHTAALSIPDAPTAALSIPDAPTLTLSAPDGVSDYPTATSTAAIPTANPTPTVPLFAPDMATVTMSSTEMDLGNNRDISLVICDSRG